MQAVSGGVVVFTHKVFFSLHTGFKFKQFLQYSILFSLHAIRVKQADYKFETLDFVLNQP